MISFITISQSDEKVGALNQNLELVFGRSSPWELLVADGSELDIFQGFNKMAAEANGDNLIFLHDDVRLLCNRECFDKPFELLSKPFTGIIGAAGTVYMPADGCWWKAPHTDCRGAVYHPSKTDTIFGVHLNAWPHMTARFGETLICDGVLLMCSKRTFNKLEGFDEGTFKGFHFYDIDISLRAHLHGLQNYVAPIPVLHNSYGFTNENWEENRLRFISKHKKILPARL
ncbi:MAG TPA: glycosyltransferase [Methylomirabilota bacterium]|nr:glycosyltransferase [Methylomirabilota bacterium]